MITPFVNLCNRCSLLLLEIWGRVYFDMFCYRFFPFCVVFDIVCRRWWIGDRRSSPTAGLEAEEGSRVAPAVRPRKNVVIHASMPICVTESRRNHDDDVTPVTRRSHKFLVCLLAVYCSVARFCIRWWTLHPDSEKFLRWTYEDVTKKSHVLKFCEKVRFWKNREKDVGDKLRTSYKRACGIVPCIAVISMNFVSGKFRQGNWDRPEQPAYDIFSIKRRF